MSRSSQQVIAVNCSYCRRLLEVDPKFAGQTVRCKCGATVSVPWSAQNRPFERVVPDPTDALMPTAAQKRGRKIDPVAILATAAAALIFFTFWGVVSLFRGQSEQEFYADRERSQAESHRASEYKGTRKDKSLENDPFSVGYTSGWLKGNQDRNLGRMMYEARTQRDLEDEAIRWHYADNSKSARQFMKGHAEGYLDGYSGVNGVAHKQ